MRIMPIDTEAQTRAIMDYLANRSAVGAVAVHPIWFAVILTATILLILYTLWDGAFTFKLIFYMLAGVFGSVLLHDTLAHHRDREQTEHNRGLQIATEIQNSVDRSVNDAGPRDLEDIPDMLIADRESAYIRPETVDDLARAVNLD